MYYLGIDLGGTNIAVGVVDKDYNIIARAKCKTRIPCDEGLIDDLAATAQEALKNAGLTLDDVPWVGIGCPGTINRATGYVEYANNLYLENFNLRPSAAEAEQACHCGKRRQCGCLRRVQGRGAEGG